jgi:hypothetical protein
MAKNTKKGKKKVRGKINILKNNHPKLKPQFIDKLNKTTKSKYLSWVVKMIDEMGYAEAKPQDKRDITITVKEAVRFFDKCLPPLKTQLKYNKENGLGNRNLIDIYTYTSVDEVYNTCNNAIDVQRVLNRLKHKDVGKDESLKIYEDDNLLVVIPLTTKASCKYGSGTKWCTASRGGSYFSSYMSTGILYYLIVKNDKMLGSWSPFNFRRKSKDTSRYKKIAFLFRYGRNYRHSNVQVFDTKDRDDSRTHYFVRQFGGRINIFKRLLHIRSEKNTDWLDAVTGKKHPNRGMVDSWIGARKAIKDHWNGEGKTRKFARKREELRHGKYKKQTPYKKQYKRGVTPPRTLQAYDIVGDPGIGYLPGTSGQREWLSENEQPLEVDVSVQRRQLRHDLAIQNPRMLGESHDQYRHRLFHLEARHRARLRGDAGMSWLHE